MLVNAVTKNRADKISCFSLFMYFVFFLNEDITTRDLTYYLPYLCCSLSLMWQLYNNSVRINKYFVWRLFMVLWCILSMYMLAEDYSSAFTYTKIFVLQSIVWVLAVIMADRIGFTEIIRLFVISVLITVVYVLCIADYSKILELRLGSDVLGESWNANAIGLMTAYSFLLILLVEKVERKQFFSIRFFQTATKYLLVAMTFLSGSRKAIMIFLIGWFVFYVLAAKNPVQIIRNFIIMLIITAILFTLLMEVPFLYDIAGSRIENMMSYFGSGEMEDGSINWRNRMVEYGWQFFKEKPWFGYGINNYRIEFGKIFNNYTYAHNNYIEMLVNGGVFGFLLYYSILLVVKSYYKMADNSFFKKYILAIFIIIFAMDFGMVSYLDVPVQFMICILLCGLKNAQNYEQVLPETEQEVIVNEAER